MRICMAKARTELDSQELAREVARLADTKLADDIVVLDMRDLVAYTDYLVIATARNERQLPQPVRALPRRCGLHRLVVRRLRKRRSHC